MTTLHVTPIGDQVGHDTSTANADCVCGPEVRPATQADGSVRWLLVHHSLDGREHATRRRRPPDGASPPGRPTGQGRHGVRHGDRSG